MPTRTGSFVTSDRRMKGAGSVASLDGVTMARGSKLGRAGSVTSVSMRAFSASQSVVSIDRASVRQCFERSY